VEVTLKWYRQLRGSAGVRREERYNDSWGGKPEGFNAMIERQGVTAMKGEQVGRGRLEGVDSILIENDPTIKNGALSAFSLRGNRKSSSRKTLRYEGLAGKSNKKKSCLKQSFFSR